MTDSQHRPVAEQVIHGLVSGVIALDAEGRLLLANPAAARHLHVPSSALSHGTEFASISALQPLAQVIQDVAQDNESVTRKEVVLHPTPDQTWELGVSVSPLEGPAAYNGVILLFTDMTERRQLERAASVNRHLAALGELAAGVVHQLRNPLTIIAGRAELLARHTQGNERAEKSLVAIREEADHMEESIAQFLAFSKPFEIRPLQTTAMAIVERAMKLNEHKASQKGIEVTVAVPEDLTEMWVDPMRVAEALSNIVDNAVDELGESGAIEIEVWQEPESTLFEVRDSGPGIHLNDDEDLLSPFFTKKHDGTGLGLSVVHRIVSAQGGDVTYGNRETGGAWFRIAIPTRQHAAYED